MTTSNFNNSDLAACMNTVKVVHVKNTSTVKDLKSELAIALELSPVVSTSTRPWDKVRHLTKNGYYTTNAGNH